MSAKNAVADFFLLLGLLVIGIGVLFNLGVNLFSNPYTAPYTTDFFWRVVVPFYLGGAASMVFGFCIWYFIKDGSDYPSYP